jgi:hypothetical protein
MHMPSPADVAVLRSRLCRPPNKLATDLVGFAENVAA